MPTKTHPFGTKLQYDADDISTYTDIVDLISVTPPSIEFGESEDTHLESANAFREWSAGWGDAGTITFTVFMTKGQFSTLVSTIAYGRTSYYWKVLFPLISGESSNSQWKAYGFIKGISHEEITVDGDKKIRAQITVRLSGRPTFTAGS